MSSLNKKIRFLPIIGIVLTLVGYVFLTMETFKLNEKKKSLNSEIAELENVKARLTKESKEKDTIITIQDTIISQSSDKATVKKGVELRNKIKEPSSKFFTVTTRENSNVELAQKFEKEGFHYLIEKNVDKAIISFRKSENSANGYHLVYEITSYLEKQKRKLYDVNSVSWKETYRQMVKDYSWGMPEHVKLKMIEMSR